MAHPFRTVSGPVAVLSDIHGVLPALDAALADPRLSAAELIVVTGDHASGPQPVQVLDRLAGLGDRAVLVRGNADRELLDHRAGVEFEIPDEIVPWAAAQLADRHLDQLAALPHPVVLDLAGFGPTAFCHGTVRDDDEVVLVDTRPGRWSEVFAGFDERVRTVVCGHTHMPFVRLVEGRTVVNPGSVGMPYGRPGAHWALLRDGAITLGRTEFDPVAGADQIRATCDYPNLEDWLAFFLPPDGAVASDIEVIEVFGPRDGR